MIWRPGRIIAAKTCAAPAVARSWYACGRTRRSCASASAPGAATAGRLVDERLGDAQRDARQRRRHEEWRVQAELRSDDPPTAGPTNVPIRLMPPNDESARPRSAIGMTSVM